MSDGYKFTFGDKVQHVCAGEDEVSGVVVGVLLRQDCHCFEVSWSDGDTSFHFDLELRHALPTCEAEA